MFVTFERTLSCNCLSSARVIHTTRPSIQLPRKAAYTVVRWFLAALDCLTITVDIADSTWARARCPILSSLHDCTVWLGIAVLVFDVVCFCSKRPYFCSTHCIRIEFELPLSCGPHRVLLRRISYIVQVYLRSGV